MAQVIRDIDETIRVERKILEDQRLKATQLQDKDHNAG